MSSFRKRFQPSVPHDDTETRSIFGAVVTIWPASAALFFCKRLGACPPGPVSRSCLDLHRRQVDLLAIHAPVFFGDFKDADIGRYLAVVGLGMFAEDCRRLGDHARLGLRVKATLQSVDLEAHNRLGSLPSGSEH